MIYYPLSATLMLAGIREILIISTPRDLPVFEDLFGTGEQLGLRMEYAVQEYHKRIGGCLYYRADFIGQDSVALVLGDNIFTGRVFPECCGRRRPGKRATIFGYWCQGSEGIRVVEFDESGSTLSIEEKPENPKSKL